MLECNVPAAEFYDKQCELHGGRGWKASHWADSQMQYENFQLVVANTMYIPRDHETILDIGCGQADLFKHLTECQNTPYYHGIDISSKMIDAAKKKYGIHAIDHPGFAPNPPKAVFEVADFFTKDFDKQYDWVVAIGTFNYKLAVEDQTAYVQRAIKKMFDLCKKGMAVTLLKDRGYTFHDEYPHLIPFNAPKMLEYCLQLSPHVVLNHSYLSSEFAIFMYKEEMANN